MESLVVSQEVCVSNQMVNSTGTPKGGCALCIPFDTTHLRLPQQDSLSSAKYSDDSEVIWYNEDGQEAEHNK